jgi:glycosyltransferase involved in cell wall biosynthesis
MLIVHLITGLQCGGAENQLQQLVLASDSRRFRHVVISLLEGGAIGFELKEAGIEVHSLGMKGGPPSPVGMVRLVRLLRRLRPNVLHCWLYHACLMGLLGGHWAGIPRVIWGLRSANAGLRGYSLWTRAVVRLCARFSSLPDAVVMNSETSRAVHQNWGYNTAKVRVIPNGVDVQRFCPDPEARRAVRAELGLGHHSVLIGLFARYSPMKDHETFLRAAGMLHAQYPDVRFLMAGERITADNGPLSRIVQENELQQVLYLLGPRRDLPRLTAALDISCLSSWSESFPNVVVEAMACAVPCVVTDAGGTRLIVGDTGRVVPSCDPLALAEAMSALTAIEAAERGALGQKARERVCARFSLQKTVSAYEDIYDESRGKCSREGERIVTRAEVPAGFLKHRLTK